LPFVYDVIMQQRGIMNHLDNRRYPDMFIRNFAAAATGQQNQAGTNHLAAATTQVLEQSIHIARLGRSG
jgi:hypothetical protein